MRRLVQLLLLALLLLPLSLSAAGSGKIKKVLPHLLDQKGRHTLSPSLYERDAYQDHLRKHPSEISALRFDIQWQARPTPDKSLQLRLEIRGSKTTQPFVLETRFGPRVSFNRWTSLTLTGNEYQRVGEIIAWRASLWEEGRFLGEQKSFLW